MRSGNGSYFFKSTYTSCKNFVKSKNKIRKHKIQSVEPNIFKIQVAMDFTMMMIALTAFSAALMASSSLSQRIGIIIFAVVGIIIFAVAVVARMILILMICIYYGLPLDEILYYDAIFHYRLIYYHLRAIQQISKTNHLFEIQNFVL